MAFTVSGSMTQQAFGTGIKVIVLTGAVEAGGASAGQTVSPPNASLAPAASNSFVVFGTYNESSSTAYTASASNTLLDNTGSPGTTQTGDGFYSGTVTSGSPVTVGCSAPTGVNTSLAAYEIQPSGGSTPVNDASTPALATSGTGTATTASFTPPNNPTTVLVAIVTGASLTGNVSSVSDTSGLGLTWTQQASFQNTGTGTASVIFTATMPGATAAQPVTAPARPGRTWLRRFKHRQTPPMPPAAQTVQAGLTDSGTGADSLAVAAGVPLADAGQGADALAIASSVPLSDSGTGSDALAVASAVPFTDSGTSTEALGIMPGLTDSGTGTDALSVLVVTPVALTDSGTGTDALSISQPTGLTDAGQGSDSLAIVQPTGLADSGTSAEALGIMPGLTDAGQGTDVLSITLASAIPLTDAGSAADTLGIMPGLTDSGTGTASLAIASAVTLSEAGTGADAFAVTQPTGLTVTGHGTDSLTIVPVTFGAAPGAATAANRLAGSAYAQHSAASVQAANRPAQLVTAGNSI